MILRKQGYIKKEAIMSKSLLILAIIINLAVSTIISNPIFAQEKHAGNIVKVAGDKGQWVLMVNGKPYYIKGAWAGKE